MNNNSPLLLFILLHSLIILYKRWILQRYFFPLNRAIPWREKKSIIVSMLKQIVSISFNVCTLLLLCVANLFRRRRRCRFSKKISFASCCYSPRWFAFVCIWLLFFFLLMLIRELLVFGKPHYETTSALRCALYSDGFQLNRVLQWNDCWQLPRVPQANKYLLWSNSHIRVFFYTILFCRLFVDSFAACTFHFSQWDPLPV